MIKPFGYYDLVEAFSRPGCAVCNLLRHDVDRFLDGMLYEYVNDPETHQSLRAGRGLCNEHSWQLAHYKGGVLGIAIVYEAVMDELLKITEDTPASLIYTWSRLLGKLSGADSGQSASALADALEPTGPCIACALLSRSEEDYTKALGAYVADPSLETAYRNSDGICLPHVRQTLRRAPDPTSRELLMSIQIAHWTRLKAELEEFSRKYDFRHADEVIGTEGDSWLRAIRHAAGERGIFGVGRRPT